MSAQEYRARADALDSSADVSIDYGLILELEATAAQWRKLAELADMQDTLRKALEATRD